MRYPDREKLNRSDFVSVAVAVNSLVAETEAVLVSTAGFVNVAGTVNV